MTNASDSFIRPEERGYVIHYRQGEANHCPGCGRSAWHIGRVSAECAWCFTALPLGRDVGEVVGKVAA